MLVVTCLQVEVVNGKWQGKKAVLMLEFGSMRDCRMWYEGTPDVKQPDWLDGADIIGVEMMGSFVAG